jgi:LuxR family maltose regulon positive regulatory protein
MLDNTPYALISTKLQRPRIGRDLVQRPRLLEQLAGRRGAGGRGGQRPRLLEQLADPAALTLVIAPAGYGKTTLLSAWLSLDAQDSDLITFATYLVAAVQTLFSTAGTETVELLNGVMRPPLAALIRSLLNTFESIEQEFILVLGDYHVIHDNAVHELITELVRYAPRSLYLVVAA